MFKKLCSVAIAACENAYAPYSSFSVGAALLCESGKIYTGSNIENSSFGATVCAERVALFSAVHSGERKFSAIAIAAAENGEGVSVSPCGICRQTLSEFCDKDFKILCVEPNGEYKEYTLGQLLPDGFLLEK